jgi:hypothetical protein
MLARRLPRGPAEPTTQQLVALISAPKFQTTRTYGVLAEGKVKI